MTLIKTIPEEVSSLISLNRKSRFLGVVLFCSLIVLICIAANMGEANIMAEQTVRIIAGKLMLNPSLYAGISGGFVSIIWDIRLPRILAGGVVGCC